MWCNGSTQSFGDCCQSSSLCAGTMPIKYSHYPEGASYVGIARKARIQLRKAVKDGKPIEKVLDLVEIYEMAMKLSEPQKHYFESLPVEYT